MVFCLKVEILKILAVHPQAGFPCQEWQFIQGHHTHTTTWGTNTNRAQISNWDPDSWGWFCSCFATTPLSPLPGVKPGTSHEQECFCPEIEGPAQAVSFSALDIAARAPQRRMPAATNCRIGPPSAMASTQNRVLSHVSCHCLGTTPRELSLIVLESSVASYT